METVKLASIVMKFSPQMFPFLKKHELESNIVLANGIEALETEDVLEIIHYSISVHQKNAFLH